MTILKKLRKEIIGEPMNEKQLKLLHELREKVRLKQISVAEAHQIWKSKHKVKP